MGFPLGGDSSASEPIPIGAEQMVEMLRNLFYDSGLPNVRLLGTQNLADAKFG